VKHYRLLLLFQNAVSFGSVVGSGRVDDRVPGSVVSLHQSRHRVQGSGTTGSAETSSASGAAALLAVRNFAGRSEKLFRKN
jgi:hypothetical protein